MTKANGGSNGGTAASRPGGKFGGGAASSGGRRGKFAKLKPPSAAGDASSSADAAATAANTAAAAAKASKKRVRTERQAKLFADLDEAEATVLGMIALASETASALSDLASGTEAASTTTGGGDDTDTDAAAATATAAKKIAELGKKNGEDYLDKVARVHALLTPHAEKVVAYSNHEVDTAEADAAADNNEETAKSETEAREKKNNMYAAKVEMRLAIERRDVLKEFLRLEKEELGMEDDDDGNDEEDEQKQPAASGEKNGGDATATTNTSTRKGKRRRAG